MLHLVPHQGEEKALILLFYQVLIFLDIKWKRLGHKLLVVTSG